MRMNVIKAENAKEFINEFNRNLVTKDFLNSCEKASELFRGKNMTNADRIRSLTDEELARILDEAVNYFDYDECKYRKTDKCG